uniref:peptidylglycine monooxygenase n=1 Tax=Eptatretus burgeri TaxID=7764 RepID=A0A8C4Q1Z8_EPTBU
MKCTSRRRPAVGLGFSLDVRMPSVRPTKADDYLCTGVHIPSPEATYIVNFIPRASMEKVHHMLLFGCKLPGSQKRYWDCGAKTGPCQGPPNILYAWARNATATHLPEDVGFQVSGESGINYLVLQVHYANIAAFKESELDCSGLTLSMISQSPPYLAGILLMVANSGIIPAGKKEANIDISCEYNIPTPMYAFAFRVHAHYLSNVISAYRVRKGKWDLIGRQNPFMPQAFYPRNETMSIENGDTLAARCVYNAEAMETDTIMG